ncbi:hypothetical protein IC614_04525 [Allosphingosinicella flava]|uniref:Lysozyme inhibitor LprI N-terminal domain-containing protein n=1 Tax=Allosphingosinicella flava TaxID=2771430 RepID=A0A7T2LMR8_9SPHN|nr:hypothetical protein [Sphingosinicella flava]QPQ55855.1 hypothetical protein IC614_04525 [Sphingosinicella flava]
MMMDRRKILLALLGVLIFAAAIYGYGLTKPKESAEASKAAVKEQRRDALQQACASPATYNRLKEVLFEEAIRIRNSDPVNLDTFAAHSVVRMENPVVKSRDEDLNVTVCSGLFILEVPPGAEAAFGGERHVAAQIEYAAQAAADGSGLVYRMTGAEPIIYRLAAFDLQRQGPGSAVPGQRQAQAGQIEPSFAAPPVPQTPASPPPERQPVTKAAPTPRAPPTSKQAPVRQASSSNPSFNCRYAKTRGERMVCGSNRLAAQDRAMSSLFYSALSDAGPQARRALRSTRSRFLSYRDSCPSEACVSEAYEGRMREIRDIMTDTR